MKYQTIEYIENRKLAVLKLNRPEKRNAINGLMIDELTELFNRLQDDPELVLLQIVGKGEAFCAGADIDWLNELGTKPVNEIEAEFQKLSVMLEKLYSLPQLIVSLVHGSVFGGGLGLMSCSDFIISSPNTVYSFSEIKLGLIPATISPYIVKKTGLQQVKQLFYTGERFDENKALQMGLIDQVAQGNPGNAHYETLMETLLKQPHHALKALKALLRGIESGTISEKNQQESCRLIAGLIQSEETLQLFSKFLSGKTVS